LPSDNTVNAANSLAAQFVAESRTLKQFNENAEKRKFNKQNAVDIKPLDNTIMGLDGDNRQLVKWIFEADKGDVAEASYQVGDKFVVPVVLEVYEKGTMPPDKARPLVEYKLRNDKKAEQIIKKLANASSMEAVIKASGFPAQRADSLRFNGGPNSNIGNESKVIGAAFNPNFKAPKVSPPIKGTLGVFVISVENIGAVANPDFDVKMQQTMMQKQQAGQLGYSTLEIIKKDANIKDNRAKFF
jgi:peptidyl-prolyl cis-trans isomerase D